VSTWRFKEREGLLEADLGPEWPGFNETLSDSVTTRAPKGEPEGLSTYWIDRTLTALAKGGPPGTVLVSGNATSLILTAEGVCAHSDYEVFDDEQMPMADFVRGMSEWREATMALLE
jgi:hypothetical protein